MLNAPLGRFLTLRRAERHDPRETWQYQHHTADSIRRMPPAIGKM
jgi:hypothetical protein